MEPTTNIAFTYGMGSHANSAPAEFIPKKNKLKELTKK